VRKVLTWAALIIGVLWVLKNPAGAAAAVHQVFNALSTLAASL
jgi:hypothetical protein